MQATAKSLALQRARGERARGLTAIRGVACAPDIGCVVSAHRRHHVRPVKQPLFNGRQACGGTGGRQNASFSLFDYVSHVLSKLLHGTTNRVTVRGRLDNKSGALDTPSHICIHGIGSPDRPPSTMATWKAPNDMNSILSDAGKPVSRVDVYAP